MYLVFYILVRVKLRELRRKLEIGENPELKTKYLKYRNNTRYVNHFFRLILKSKFSIIDANVEMETVRNNVKICLCLS